MSALAIMQDSLTAHRTGAESRHRRIVVVRPRGKIRRTRLRSSIFGGMLLALIAAPVAVWALAFPSPATNAQGPQEWRYGLTVEDGPAKTYGPFADVAACDLSLIAAMADLNRRLPGLYVAEPCIASSSQPD